MEDLYHTELSNKKKKIKKYCVISVNGFYFFLNYL